MQLLHPLLRCSKKMPMILVTGRKHVAAGAQAKSLLRGRW
jgi:FixJ family two-component response regulator